MRQTKATLTAVTILLLFASPVWAQSPGVGGVLTGLAASHKLKELASLLEEVVKQAEASGNTLVIEAAGQANLLVQNLQVTYEKELNNSKRAVDSSVTSAIQQADEVVSKLKSGLAADVNGAMRQAQLLLNQLPGSDKVPQFISFRPEFIATGVRDYPVTITINGNFVHAHRKGFAPTLKLGGRDVPLSGNTTTGFEFTAQASDIASLQDKFGHVNAALTVPFREGLILRHRREGTFRFFLGTLPSSPGKLVFHCRTKRTVVASERQHTAAPESHPFVDSFKQHSNGSHTYSASPPSAPWYIDMASVSYSLTGPRNNTADGNEGDDWTLTRVPGQAAYTLDTHGGKVDFQIKYDIVKDAEVTDDAPSDVVLHWGDQRSFECQASDWTLDFDSFLGESKQIVGVGDYNLIRVELVGSKVAISAADPKEVRPR